MKFFFFDNGENAASTSDDGIDLWFIGKGLISSSCVLLRMPRFLGIDYGKKRCGIAETDDIPLIATSVDTVPPGQLMAWLEDYFSHHDVHGIVVGQPVQYDGTPAELEEDIVKFIAEVQKRFPMLEVHRVDESFSSVRAKEAMIHSGARKKKRRVKGNVDKIAATLILQEFLESRRTRRN